MSLPEEKVTVEVLKKGLWAQEAWLPQLDVKKGDRVIISIAIAYKLQQKKKCKILKDASSAKSSNRVPKQIKEKSEQNPAMRDKEAAEG